MPRFLAFPIALAQAVPSIPVLPVPFTSIPNHQTTLGFDLEAIMREDDESSEDREFIVDYDQGEEFGKEVGVEQSESIVPTRSL